MFRQADTEESGLVDPGVVPALALKVLGNDIKESERQMIQYKSELKAGMYVCMYVCMEGNKLASYGGGQFLQVSCC